MANMFDLNTALTWARRTSSDEPVSSTETLTGNGGTSYQLNNDGDITLLSVVVDSDNVDLSQVSVVGSEVVFTSNQVSGATIVVTYSRSQYSNNQMLGFLADAALEVGADVPIQWAISQSTFIISSIPDAEIDSVTGELKNDIQRLIVLMVDLKTREDKANSAGDDAIMIKDGDTSIDTSRGSAAQQKNVAAKRKVYDQKLSDARKRRFTGRSMDMTSNIGPVGGPFGPLGGPYGGSC